MQRLLDRDDIQAAKALLDRIESRLDVPPWSYDLQYFQALILFRQEQFEAAEGRLRGLQARLGRSETLYTQAGQVARPDQLPGEPPRDRLVLLR